MRMNRYEEALEPLREALAIRTRASGEEHHEVGVARTNLAAGLAGAGFPVEAVEEYEAAAAVLQRTLGEDHAFVGECLLGLGQVLMTLREYRRAEAALSQAAPILEKAKSPGLGEARASLRRARQAVAPGHGVR